MLVATMAHMAAGGMPVDEGEGAEAGSAPLPDPPPGGGEAAPVRGDVWG